MTDFSKRKNDIVNEADKLLSICWRRLPQAGCDPSPLRGSAVHVEAKPKQSCAQFRLQLQSSPPEVTVPLVTPNWGSVRSARGAVAPSFLKQYLLFCFVVQFAESVAAWCVQIIGDLLIQSSLFSFSCLLLKSHLLLLPSFLLLLLYVPERFSKWNTLV